MAVCMPCRWRHQGEVWGEMVMAKCPLLDLKIRIVKFTLFETLHEVA